MARLIVGIFRMMPLEILIGIIAVIGYLIVSQKKGTSIAKEFLIKVVFYINSVLSLAFLIITLYAFVDKNISVAELSGACLILCAFSLLITIFCKRIFLKHRPNYRWKRFVFKKTPHKD